MQEDKREYAPPVLVPLGTVRSLTRTSEVMGSPGKDALSQSSNRETADEMER